MAYISKINVDNTDYELHDERLGTIGQKDSLTSTDITNALGYTPASQNTALTSLTIDSIEII